MWHEGVPAEYRNSIVTGDARVLAERLPDASVDLIFTDPVYDRIEDYAWLAETAARVLKPGGACVAYYWCTHLPRLTAAMGVPGLVFRWNVFDLKIGVASLDGGQFTRVMTRPALVYSKAHHDGSFWLSDVVYSKPMGRDVNHEWSKNPSAATKWLSMFPNGVMLDPFCGGGTHPAIAKMQARPFIAFEIDEPTAQRARERVAQTQAMEPVLLGIQEPLALEEVA